MNSMKFCISAKDTTALRLAHYHAMSIIPEEVSGINHHQNSFIVDSNIKSTSTDNLSPFLRWCKNLGKIEVNLLN